MAGAEQGSDASTAIRSLMAAGCFVVRLADSGPDEHPDKSVDVLVHGRAARRVLDALPWRYRLGGTGLWRLVPAIYTWPSGFQLQVHTRLPTAPLPAATLGRLESRLWSSPVDEDGAHVPGAELGLVYLALQVARPGGRYHDGEAQAFSRLARSVADWGVVRTAASEVGLLRVLDRVASAIAEDAAARPTVYLDRINA